MDLMDDVSLQHHGIKGMRWGHREQELPVGTPSAGAPPKKSGGAGKTTAKASSRRSFRSDVQLQAKANAYNAQARKIAAHAQVDPAQLHAKYGPERPPVSQKPQKQGMSTRKKVAIGAGVVGVVGAAAVGYGAYKLSPKALAAGKGGVANIMSKKGSLKIGEAAKAESAFGKPSLFKLRGLKSKGSADLVKNEAEALQKAGFGKTRVLAILKREENLAGLRRNDYSKLTPGGEARGIIRNPFTRGRLQGQVDHLALRDAGVKVRLTEGDKTDTLFDALTKVAGHNKSLPATDGLDMHWSKGVDLPKGSVLKRLSSVAETDIRPGGFYAAHRPEDVQSYKAILPSYWDSWGVGKAEKGGFLNHYEALKPIKAPSGEESFSIFKSLVHSDDKFAADIAGSSIGSRVRALDDRGLREEFMFHAHHDWAGATPKPAGESYFSAVRKRGFNALIDFNDAGKMGKQPVRVIDSSAFKIVKNEQMTLDDFYNAAKDWSPDLVHKLKVAKDFIMHHLKD